MIGKTSDSIFYPLMVNRVSYLLRILSKYKQNDQLWPPVKPGNCDAVPYEHTFIASGMFPNLPPIYKNDWKNL